MAFPSQGGDGAVARGQRGFEVLWSEARGYWTGKSVTSSYFRSWRERTRGVGSREGGICPSTSDKGKIAFRAVSQVSGQRARCGSAMVNLTINEFYVAICVEYHLIGVGAIGTAVGSQSMVLNGECTGGLVILIPSTRRVIASVTANMAVLLQESVHGTVGSVSVRSCST